MNTPQFIRKFQNKNKTNSSEKDGTIRQINVADKSKAS